MEALDPIELVLDQTAERLHVELYAGAAPACPFQATPLILLINVPHRAELTLERGRQLYVAGR